MLPRIFNFPKIVDNINVKRLIKWWNSGQTYQPTKHRAAGATASDRTRPPPAAGGHAQGGATRGVEGASEDHPAWLPLPWFRSPTDPPSPRCHGAPAGDHVCPRPAARRRPQPAIPRATSQTLSAPVMSALAHTRGSLLTRPPAFHTTGTPAPPLVLPEAG